jgi:hypothetical protein
MDHEYFSRRTRVYLRSVLRNRNSSMICGWNSFISILVKLRFTLSKNLPVSATEIVVYMPGEMLPDTVLKS